MPSTYVVRFKGKDTNAKDKEQALAWHREGRGAPIELTDTEEIDLSPTPTPTPSPSPSPTPKAPGLSATSVNRGSQIRAAIDSGNVKEKYEAIGNASADADASAASAARQVDADKEAARKAAVAASEARREALKAKLKK
jgi:hypothetical protein